MTTTAHEDQFTIGTQTIELVRQPYDTAAILKRNVADLEVALRTQTERAEAAEAEIEAVREDNHSMMLEIHNLRIELEQKPVAWMDAEGDVYKDEPAENWCPPHVPLYAASVPVPAVPAAQNDDPICTTEQARFFLVRFMLEHFADKSFEQYIHNHLAGDYAWQLAHAINSLPQSHDAPADWREVMTELAADVQAACDAEHPHRDQYPSVMRKYNNDMEIVEKARALLQSSPQVTAVPAEIIELSKKYAIDTEAYHAAMDALLQSAEVRHD